MRMLSAELVKLGIVLLALVVAYVISSIISGIMQVKIRQWVGDRSLDGVRTSEINIATYISWTDLGIMLLFKVLFNMLLAWGRALPLMPLYFDEPYRRLRLFIGSISESLASIVILFMSLALSFLIMGRDSLSLGFLFSFFLNNTVSLSQFVQEFSHVSSPLLVVVILLVAFTVLNLFIAPLSFIINTVRFVVMESGHPAIMAHADIVVILGSLLSAILFAGSLQTIILTLLLYLVTTMASFFGT